MTFWFLRSRTQTTRRVRALERAGVEVVRADSRMGQINLEAVLAELGRREILSVLLEAGPTLNGAALNGGNRPQTVSLLRAQNLRRNARALRHRAETESSRRCKTFVRKHSARTSPSKDTCRTYTARFGVRQPCCRFCDVRFSAPPKAGARLPHSTAPYSLADAQHGRAFNGVILQRIQRAVGFTERKNLRVHLNRNLRRDAKKILAILAACYSPRCESCARHTASRN